MTEQVLRLHKGDSVALPSAEGGRTLFRVVRRVRDGYVFSPTSGGPDVHWRNGRIFDAYLVGELEHWPLDLSGLDSQLAEMLQKDIESWSERLIFEALCREKYVLRADCLRLRGVAAKVAYKRASKVVNRAYARQWSRELEKIIDREEQEALLVSRKPRSTHSKPVKQLASFSLSWQSVRNWYQDWIAGERDIRVLIAKYHKRGWHGPHQECLTHKQESDDKPLCQYGAMRKIAQNVWMSPLKVTKVYAYDRFKEECKILGLKPFSKTTFHNFIWKHYTDFEEYRAQHGPRLAFLKFKIFKRRDLPTRALEEVEVDHCLLDVWVSDRSGRKARPWLTVLICRATKMIVGYHLSFDVPSYTTLSRAIIHAISPKDLSSFPDLKNDWPCHGVFDCLITDRGLEFLSESLNRAGRDLRFAIINLPGYMPHLKGTVERYFGTLGIRVLSHMEGSTRSRTDQFYDPKVEARFSLEELSARILHWIVDEYHQTEHDTLGVAPIRKWQELVVDSLDGGVRPVGSFSRLVMLMGEVARRKISNVGIQFDNNLYASYELNAIREQRRGRTDWFRILADPTDRGHLWVLDKVTQRWLIVPAVNPKTAKGLNKFAMKIVMRMARRIAGKGKPVTDSIMIEARERCDREAATASHRSALRYGSEGALATQVAGNRSGLLAVLAGAVIPVTSFDGNDDQGELFSDFVSFPPTMDGTQPAPKVPAKAAVEVALKNSKRRDKGAERGRQSARPEAPSANLVSPIPPSLAMVEQGYASPKGEAETAVTQADMSVLKSLVARGAANRKVLS